MSQNAIDMQNTAELQNAIDMQNTADMHNATEMHKERDNISVVSVPIRLLQHGYLPNYATASADICLCPGETKLLPLGFVIALPTDCEAQIRPRSGLSLKTSLRLPNSPGTIDADYRHEVGVILENTFNPSTLPGLIAARPELLSELVAKYHLLPLADLLPAMDHTGSDHTTPLLVEYLNQFVWVDENNMPYGTIRIRKGERIAQMIVTTVLRAVFDQNTDPASAGHDRGGGFGSTGSIT
jgi:dUTP pyrophosphatase